MHNAAQFELDVNTGCASGQAANAVGEEIEWRASMRVKYNGIPKEPAKLITHNEMKIQMGISTLLHFSVDSFQD